MSKSDALTLEDKYLMQVLEDLMKMTWADGRFVFNAIQIAHIEHVFEQALFGSSVARALHDAAGGGIEARTGINKTSHIL